MKNLEDSQPVTAIAEKLPQGRPFNTPHVWTPEVVENMCVMIAAGYTVKRALKEEFPGIEGERALNSKQASFLECVLYGPEVFNLMYRRARRSRAHSAVDKAEDTVQGLIELMDAPVSDDPNVARNASNDLKGRAVATRVVADSCFRAAELWSPEEFGRHNNLGGSLNVQINTSLPAPPDPDQVGGGFHVEIAPAPVPSQLPAAKDEGKRASDNG